MSSESDADETSPSSRRRSSTPQSPRKRRRLGSTDSSRLRKHDNLRRHEIEARYNDNYRLLFNEHVTEVASRFDINESIQHYSNQVGSSVWSSTEQTGFFAALERLGKDDIPGIAGTIGTKTETEAREFLILLQDAAIKQGDAKLTLRDIPAAIEVGSACDQQLDQAGDALAWYQERFEATQEQQRYGKYWLITGSIADEVEDAINGVATPRSASTPHDREPPRIGSGVAGACASCKKRKRKCDRRLPCTSCAKSNTECVYPNDSSNVTNPSPTPITRPKDGDGEGQGEDIDASGAHAAGTGILLAVPEATLLQPKMMLTLSKDIFMNRSAEFPSHWPHWSHYTSELATEPSIYRTAFNDFHRLVISVTKRMVQTAIIQATSRLRAQRLRGKKGLLPFVKTRDVYTAIDVLGMKRNGSERWRGVARRCGLKVFSSKTTPKGKRRREVPWSEVERIMNSATSPNERSATETETSAEPDNFRSRAVRSGTPLPMHRLAVSESEDDFENADIADDSDSDDLEHFTDDELLPSAHHTVQGRDDSGRYTSVPPTMVPDTAMHQPDSLEEFDQEASRQEERALWDMLSIKPASEDGSAKTDDDPYETDLEMNEKVATVPGDWRQTIDYCAAWEKHKKQVPAVKFISNQKSPSPMPATHATRAYSTASPSGNNSDASSTSGSRRPARKPPVAVELRARGTNAYAALQRNDPKESYNGNISDSSSDDNEEMEKDIPAPSIETQHDAIEVESPGSDMDWT